MRFRQKFREKAKSGCVKPELQKQKSRYKKKKKKIVTETWEEMVCVVSQMILIP